MNTAMKLAAIPVATVALLGFSSLSRIRTSRLQRRRRLLAYPRRLRLSACGRHNHPSGRLAWKEGEHHVWREHPGRGYWKGSEWAPF